MSWTDHCYTTLDDLHNEHRYAHTMHSDAYYASRPLHAGSSVTSSTRECHDGHANFAFPSHGALLQARNPGIVDRPGVTGIALSRAAPQRGGTKPAPGTPKNISFADCQHSLASTPHCLEIWGGLKTAQIHYFSPQMPLLGLDRWSTHTSTAPWPQL